MCSKKCGGGISYRKRKCLPSKCPYSDPRYNKCDGNDYEEKKCNDQCCPGMYTTFSTQIFLLLLLVYSCYSEMLSRYVYYLFYSNIFIIIACVFMLQ